MWVQRNDVYLGARDMLKALKVSLHRSNIWRIAFVNDLDGKDEGTDRAVVKWKRPDEFAPGWTGSIGVLISPIQPQRPFQKARDNDSRIHWFAPATEGRKLLFKVLFSQPGYSERQLNAISVRGDRLVGRLLKRNGEIVWLLAREDELTPVEMAKIRNVMDNVKIDLIPGASEDSIEFSRALLLLSAHDPDVADQPTILDIALGKENVVLAH